MAAQPKPTIMQRSLAEVLGTFLLVFIGAGTGTAASIFAKGATSLANLLTVALAHGFALLLAVYIIGKVSGAHVNPAVTIGMASVKKIAWGDVPYYLVAQAIGAILGALAIVVVFGHTDAIQAGLGATTYSSSSPVIVWRALAAEGVGAFILVLAVMGAAIDKRVPEGWAGLVIGFALAAAIMVCGSVSGASVNPARTLGPDLVLSLFGGANHWGQYWVYLVGPIVGGVVAALLYRFIAKPDLAERVERPAPQKAAPAPAARAGVKPKR